jgi:AcrR family transcriptional regulator
MSVGQTKNASPQSELTDDHDGGVSESAPRSRRKRMTGKERRSQLLDIGRALFAERGFDGTSIEEIAAKAGVSKPVVYEHFGGKEGLYAVVVDREMERLLGMVTAALTGGHPRDMLEEAALALLEYIEESTDGFRILVRDSHAASSSGNFASLLNDIAGQVEYILGDQFGARGYDPKLAPMYAQMLVGMVALTGQYWLDVRRPKRTEVAAHLVNLAWNGLSGLEQKPGLMAKQRRKERAKAEKAAEKAARQAAREAANASRRARAREAKQVKDQRQGAIGDSAVPGAAGP